MDAGPIEMTILPVTYVAYAAGTDPPLVKIGKSKKLADRLKGQQTSAPLGLFLLAWFPGLDQEKRLHARFAGYRIRREFFRLDGNLLQFVNGRRHALGYADVDLTLCIPEKHQFFSPPEYDRSLWLWHNRQAVLGKFITICRHLLMTTTFKIPFRAECKQILIEWIDAGASGVPFTPDQWVKLLGRSSYEYLLLCNLSEPLRPPTPSKSTLNVRSSR
jgi:hypothetical protein